MDSRHLHAGIDRINAAEDRLIARKLYSHPAVLKKARRNLQRWMARDGNKQRPAFCEWERILRRLNAREIARFLRSDTPMARRLRQSSPFAGVLTEAERSEIRKR